MLVFFHVEYKIVQRISLLIHCYNLSLYMNVDIPNYVWYPCLKFFIVSIKRLAYIRFLFIHERISSSFV